MPESFRDLYAHRELLWLWTLRNLKVRYSQSLLGAAWAVLHPLSLMVMFTLLFTLFIQIPTGGIPYPIFSYTALVPWTFLSTSIALSVPSLVQNANLVTRTYFPRDILPLSAVLASFVDYLIAGLVFVGMMIVYRIPLSATFLLLPLLIAIQFLLTLGVALFASAVNVFYRDIRFVVPLGIQLWMYATPIIYPITAVPESLRRFYLLNPMAVVVESYRDITLRGTWPNWEYLAIAGLLSAAIFALGYRYFLRVEWQFADII